MIDLIKSAGEAGVGSIVALALLVCCYKIAQIHLHSHCINKCMDIELDIEEGAEKS